MPSTFRDFIPIDNKLNPKDGNKKPNIKKGKEQHENEIFNKNEVEDLKIKLEDETKINIKLQDNIYKLKYDHYSEIEKYKNNINRLKEKNEESEKLLDEKNKKLQNTIDNLNKNIEQLKEKHNIEIEKYTNDMNRLIEENEELKKLLDEKSEKLEEIQNTITNLNNTIIQLKEEHNIEIEKDKSDMNKLVEKNKELETLLDKKNKNLMIIFLN